MQILRHVAIVALAGTLGLAAGSAPALADGAASTRNILIGGAAAAAGTLLIINHNKKVHQKYAEYDQRQAQTQASANQSQAAYESERQAYAHEAALASAYRHEVALQHSAVRERDARIASLTRSLRLAKAAGSGRAVSFVRPADVTQAPHLAVAATAASLTARQGLPRDVSYGWGNY